MMTRPRGQLVCIITDMKTSVTQVTVCNFYRKGRQLLWLEFCCTLGTADVLFVLNLTCFVLQVGNTLWRCSLLFPTMQGMYSF